MDGAESDPVAAVSAARYEIFITVCHVALWGSLTTGFMYFLMKFYKVGGPVEAPRQTLYREPPPTPDYAWFWQPEGVRQCKPEVTFESYTGVIPISVNWELTETIVTNPHVFVLFCLPIPYSQGTDDLLQMLVEVSEAIRRYPDKIRRVTVAANCSRDSSMAMKHKVNNFPTISYYRNGYYYCDFLAENIPTELFKFFVSVVTHTFPERV